MFYNDSTNFEGPQSLGHKPKLGKSSDSRFQASKFIFPISIFSKKTQPEVKKLSQTPPSKYLQQRRVQSRVNIKQKTEEI